ncbi:MAG: PDZ domain-containing protein [Planctomycetes bacterium]|nr:PDZ domain-containing protein [Planctomycetota bacterium]
MLLTASPILQIALFLCLVPAPKDPEPDDKGKGFFGVQLVDNNGPAITRVEPGSPADKAGVRVNDIIRSIDSVPVANVNEAREVIGRIRPGTVTVVAFSRGDAMVTIKVKVGVRPESIP